MAEINLSSGLLADLPKEIHEGNMYIATDDSAVYIDATDDYRVRISHFPKTAYTVSEYPDYEDDFKVLGTFTSQGGQFEALHRVQLPTFIQDESRKTLMESVFPQRIDFSTQLRGGTIDDSGNLLGSSSGEYYTDAISLPVGQIYIVELENSNYLFRIFQYKTVDGATVLTSATGWNTDVGFVSQVNDPAAWIRIAFKQKAAPVDAQNIGVNAIKNNLRIKGNNAATDAGLALGGVAADARVTGEKIAELEAQIAQLNAKLNILNNLRFAPEVVNTTTAITNGNTRTTYIYMGTNSGNFTQGHWYYHNGTTWTDGGIYGNISGVTTTLESIVQPTLDTFNDLGLEVEEDADNNKYIVSNYYLSENDPSIPASRMDVVTTAAQMTNHAKVYVYTGSENGYTNGHWYYWNGTSWTDSGQSARLTQSANQQLKVKDPIMLDRTGKNIVKAIEQNNALQQQLNNLASMILEPAEYISMLGSKVIFNIGESLVIGSASSSNGFDQIGQYDVSYNGTEGLVFERVGDA